MLRYHRDPRALSPLRVLAMSFSKVMAVRGWFYRKALQTEARNPLSARKFLRTYGFSRC